MVWSDNQIEFAAQQIILQNAYRLCLASSVGALSRANNSTAQQSIYAAELLPLYGYSRLALPFVAGSYDATDQRYEFPELMVNQAIAGGNISYNHIFWTRGGQNSATSAMPVTITAGSGLLTFASAHGLVENDRIMLVGAPGATAPGGTTLNTFYYASVASSTTIRLKASTGGSAIASFTDAGSGSLYVRFCQGAIAALVSQSATQILDGQSKSFPINLIFANTGIVQGV